KFGEIRRLIGIAKLSSEQGQKVLDRINGLEEMIDGFTKFKDLRLYIKDLKNLTIGELIARLNLAGEISIALSNAYTEEGGLSVAVRSTSLVEDTMKTAAAGRFKTYVYVRGKKALLESITKCTAYYCVEYGETYPYQPILIQRMIDADSSAIVNTMNAATYSWDEFVIDSAWGAGYGLMAGDLESDMFILDFMKGVLVNKVVASKKYKYIFNQPEGIGVVKVETDANEIGRPSLSDDVIKEIYLFVVSLREIHGYPLDIEIVVKDNKIYVVQVRPIPGLFRESVVKRLSEKEEHVGLEGLRPRELPFILDKLLKWIRRHIFTVVMIEYSAEENIEYKKILEEKGYRVISFRSADKAFKFIRENRGYFSSIFADYSIVTRGKSFVKDVRSINQTIQIIGHTSHRDVIGRKESDDVWHGEEFKWADKTKQEGVNQVDRVYRDFMQDSFINWFFSKMYKYRPWLLRQFLNRIKNRFASGGTESGWAEISSLVKKLSLDSKESVFTVWVICDQNKERSPIVAAKIRASIPEELRGCIKVEDYGLSGKSDVYVDSVVLKDAELKNHMPVKIPYEKIKKPDLVLVMTRRQENALKDKLGKRVKTALNKDIDIVYPYEKFRQEISRDLHLINQNIIDGIKEKYKDSIASNTLAKLSLLKRKFKLYVFDFDDTLAKGGRRIKRKMVRELLSILKQGGHVAILTGRGMEKAGQIAGLKELLIKHIDAQTRIDYRDQIHFLCEAGGDVWRFDDRGELVHDKDASEVLEEDVRQEIDKHMKEVTAELGLETRLSRGKGLFIVKRDSEMALHFTDNKLFHHLDRAKERLGELLKDFDVNVERSSVAVDVTATTKEKSIEALLKKLNIQARDVLVGGDGHNDLGMLKIVLEHGGTAIFAGDRKMLLHSVIASEAKQSQVIVVRGPTGVREALGR
ncbi:MAG: HAD hydrolase family protein, partial [Candidatus Omnitrophica bacterium]|nr:HAD hydrolase family protein [Candidatus Omnitrophota bacterium]